MKPLNNKGSAFVQALVAVGIVGTMLYFLSPEVLKHRQQVQKTASIITARLALHSMVDFTLFGVKQRWCFSKDWMPEPCGESYPPTMAQILNHKRSVERLLMKNETVAFLRGMGVANPESVPLDVIDERINISSFSALHPVYKIIADLKGYKVEAIHVRIEKDRRQIIPEYGREVYLKITVSLLDRQGKPIEIGASKLRTISYVGVYPREVGSFALMVANDLHLNETAGSSAGDANLKQFGSRNVAAKWKGLVFESPVYVNGDVHLPKAPDIKVDKSNGDTVYTPVTFKEKLILGGGQVMRNGKEFKPRSSGAELDQFWAHVRQFGGFQKGVEVDGDRDEGLDYLSGYKTASGAEDPRLMEKCISYNLAKYNLNKTTDAELTGELLKNTGSKVQYRMGMSDKNRFNPQTGEVVRPSLQQAGWFGEILKDWSLNKKDGAIARYQMNFGRMKVVGEIPDDGTVTLAPEINLKQLKERLDRQITDAESNLLFQKSQVDQLEKQIRRTEDDISDMQRELRDEQNDKVPNVGKIARLRYEIDNAEYRVRNMRNQLTKQKNDVYEAETKLSNLQRTRRDVASKENVQPKVHITIKKPLDPTKPGNKMSNPSFRDMEVTFEHPEMLLNSNGEPLDVSLAFEAYDVSYFQGSSLRTWSQQQLGKNKGWLFFSRNGDGMAVSPRLSTAFGQSKGNLPDDEDPFIDYDIACAQLGSGSSSAFGGTDWSKSFASSSRHSWSFTNKYGEVDTLVFDHNNAYRAPNGGGTAVFTVKSIAKNCVIKDSANFVSGFLNCERLVIQSRATPLRIIASIIVTKGITIADDAYQAGITWSTIYHPQATFELRQANVLKGLNNQDCATINRYPVWHPYPSMSDVANLYRCNSISLRSKADPFRWTSVDPDCGLMNNSNSTMCKNRLVRFYVLEVSRESGI
ncbi:hypothetical protein [Bdellovibrio reynosensis]|uniref:Uncharacterized protein n=1 Tax=Bdellovibrio reynosensis TaxID=2835041 RepID=A0ABY4C9I7_9BACT|nr:hypothetical protein [Bdellovibrio reynosensis]UOF01444.1 hypothetical protein MNR06_00565 [Bdellovibrio reynosensis]